MCSPNRSSSAHGYMYRTKKRMGTFFICYTFQIQFSFPLKVVVLGKTNTTESILTIPIHIPPEAPASPPSASRLAFLSHLLYNPSLHLTALTRSCGLSLAWICFPGNKTQCLPTQCYSAFFAQNFRAYRDFNLFLGSTEMFN